MIIVGVTGKAGAGKDTVGDYLRIAHGFDSDSLAGPLKKAVQAIFCIPDEIMYDRDRREEPLDNWPNWTVRTLLQFVGTELFRNQVDPDVWVKSLSIRVQQRSADADNNDRYVITDVRFPNEIDSLGKLVDGARAYSVKVVRPEHIGTDVGLANHTSESFDLKADFVLENDGTIEDLYKKVDHIMDIIDADS